MRNFHPFEFASHLRSLPRSAKLLLGFASLTLLSLCQTKSANGQFGCPCGCGGLGGHAYAGHTGFQSVVPDVNDKEFWSFSSPNTTGSTSNSSNTRLAPPSPKSVVGGQPLNIDLNFTGDASFLPLFESAVATWEAILPSYIDGQDIVATTPGNPDFSIGDDLTTLFIDASVTAIDGAGGTLASAGPSELVNDGTFILASRGSISFDSADIGSLGGDLEAVILHEIGHILGFGTLWDFNNVFADGSGATTVGQFTGENAIEIYNEEFGFGGSETFVPIENNGGPGTADGHFDEEFFGVALNGDPTVPAGLGFGPNSGELLTGFLGTDEIFFSDTAGGTFIDIGFNVDFDAIAAFNGVVAVPEPTALLLVSSIGLFTALRRRKS